MDVWHLLDEAVSAAGRAALVTVVEARGSVPREAGARLIVRPDGGFRGTIGGGALEWRALAEAARDLAAARPAMSLRAVSLGPDLGQCCGGRVTLMTEIFVAEDLPTIRALAARGAEGPFATEAQFVSEAPHLARTVLDGAAGTGAEARLLSGGGVAERFGERLRPVALFGAGHVGRALVLALAPLPFVVTWIDERAESFPSHMPANTRAVAEPAPVRALERMPDGTFVVVMTHSHALDLAIVDAALRAERFPYVGVIGSATKRARFERRLAEAGLPAETVSRMVCPIAGGLVRSKLPAAIAAAAAVEFLATDEALALAATDEVSAVSGRQAEA